MAPDPPGVLLRETLDLLNMSQAVLARSTGLSTKHVNQICQGTAGFSAHAAVRFEEVTGVDAEIWMRLQAQYAIATARTARRDALAAERERRAAASAAVAERVARAVNATGGS